MLLQKFPSRKILFENETFLYFGGTSYLGLPTNKKFQRKLAKNLKTWGSSFGSSRNANVTVAAYNQCEEFLSKYVKSENALTVSSGMLAGKIVIDLLKNQTDCFYHFPNLHNALQINSSEPILIDGKINIRLLDDIPEKITILTDAVATSTVVPIDLSLLKLISKTKEITLVIDESHSIGILGNCGSGIFSTINYPNIKRKIAIGSLGKALGLTGGYIASDDLFISQIKNLATFVSAAGMNPAFAATLKDSKKIIIKKNVRLLANLSFVKRHLLSSELIVFNEHYPLIYVHIDDICENLKSQKIIITNFPYPNDSGSLNRIVITANHKKKDLKILIDVLNKIAEKAI